jgi:shikimate dehydrogenase
LARALAHADGARVEAVEFHNLTGLEFDVVINATSASLEGALPPLPPSVIAQGGCAYDLMYSASATTFLAWASAHGADVVADGLGMLVEQAAESFYLWRDKRPDTRPVLAALRAALLT